jgi:uncharacterized repeat protein (TIGR01451 family)
LGANVKVTIYKDPNNNNQIDTGEEVSSSASDTNGNYTLVNVTNETYKVKVDTNDGDIPGGYRLTTANDLTATVNNGNVTGQDFGFANPASVLLVKRITAINGTQISSVVDNPGSTNDNHANWPNPLNSGNNISTFLKGAIDGGTVKPGDEIEYTIYFLNSGEASAKTVRICDRIIGEQTLSGNTIELHQGDGTSNYTTISNLTTAADGDRATYYSDINSITGASCNFKTNPTENNGAIVVDVDGSSNPGWTKVVGSTAPGTANSYGFIRFKTKVNN